MCVTGSLNGKAFAGSTMLVAGGVLCIGLSQAAMRNAGVSIGDKAHFHIEPAAKPSRL
jgi:hypothetical protein